jgi:hypothetical protein
MKFLKIILFVIIVSLLSNNGFSILVENEKTSAKIEEIAKRIELIRMWKLTEELNLNEETGKKLFPILEKYDRKRIEWMEKRRKIMRSLRNSLKEGDKEGIRLAIKKWGDNEKVIRDIKIRRLEEIKGVLTVEQLAKYILFEERFEREIRRIIFNAKRRRMFSKNKSSSLKKDED